MIHVGELHMVESVILPSGLHRVKFRQDGQQPDIGMCKEKCEVTDGQYVYSTAWMDKEGIGHACLAWKEYRQITLEGESHENRN
jgi:hypothetical protein